MPLESLQQVLRSAPDYLPAVLLAGAAQYGSGQYEQSEQNLRKYIAAFPNNAYARKLLASLLLKTGEARMLVDLRTPQSTAAVLGGLYPGACLYMSTQWVNGHKPQVQKLANALVLALRYIGQHSAEEIAAQMPVEFFAGDRALYVDALRHSQAMFTPDGVMPASGPATVLKVLQAADRVVQSKTIDLAKTYTTEFALAVH